MGGGVSVNFASFLAGGSKQVLRVTMTLALDAPVARGSLVFHLLNIAGVRPPAAAFCCNWLGRGTEKLGYKPHK